MIFYLVRHGRSQANDAGLVTGTPVDLLTEAGVEQAVKLAAWLAEQDVVVDRCYVSHWQRAQQTAQRILPAADWRVDRRLGETDAGDVAEWPLARFVAEQPDFYTDAQQAYPGGESHLQLNARVLDWWREVRGEPCECVMVVAHSGPISCLLQAVLGVGMERFPAFLPANGSVSVIEVDCKAGRESARLLGFSMGPGENLASALRVAAQREAP
ncbi:Putative phosphoserine phosphatase 2 [Paraburkholderia caffeinitolerans]|uniref:Phosphoserine phosphatase 2 n=1 Tax=Paraburkholderia caffeinitolerans TaxID=1723730 RepID=A0A6J5FC21_9BURK|nr:histidine phosphatase family protein [Paraburkholderia caffeinitolerans]CAB3776393.1 Putative phosphoserine phosphatase 2 [Paraburkholderia caffeinitolerans]